MINQKIIHLKNVIIFKVLIYLLCITFFFILLPIMNNMFYEAINNSHIAKEQFQDMEDKIEFVNNSRDKITAAYNTYLDESKSKFDLGCFIKQDLNQQFLSLANELNLKEKPVLFSSTSPTSEQFNNNRNIEILTTKLMSKFRSKSVEESINFIRLFYEKLPNYNNLTSFDIEVEDFITPNSINQLAPDIDPSLINNTSNMEIKQIKLNGL